MQSLTFQSVAGRPAALLIGSAGTSHWSSSWTIDGESPALMVDVASRLVGWPEFIGSTVAAAVTSEIQYESPTRLNLTFGDRRFRLELSSPDAQTADEDESLHFAAQREIIVARVKVASIPRTVQWRLAVSVQPNLASQ